MGFALKKDESVPKGVKRIVRGELDRAVEGLRNVDAHDEAIHDARKRFKKVRAVLRLVRDALGDKVYQRENTGFRDAARPLTELRDSKVLVDALAGLKDRACSGDQAGGQADQARARGDQGRAQGTRPGPQTRPEGGARARGGRQLTPTRLAALDRALQANQRAVRKRVLQQGKALALVTRAIEQARDRVGDWSLARKGWPAVSGGLKRIYKRGRRAFAAAAADPSVENLHEWRKLAKYLWHQIQILEPSCPDELGKLANEFHELTQLLGDDHDLAVLGQTVAARPKAFGGDRVLKALGPVIDSRRAELQHQAFAVGSRIYEEPPRRFVGRIKQCWKTWRAGR